MMWTHLDIEFDTKNELTDFRFVWAILDNPKSNPGTYTVHATELFRTLYHYNRLTELRFNIYVPLFEDKSHLSNMARLIFRKRNNLNKTTCHNRWLDDTPKFNLPEPLILIGSDHEDLMNTRETINTLAIVFRIL